MSEEDDLLDILLTTAAEEIEENTQKGSKLKEVDIFKNEASIDDLIKELNNDEKSLVHSGDTDSSDDEDNKNVENRKYNDCGKQIKRILNDTTPHTKPVNGFYGPRERISWKASPSTSSNIAKPSPTPQKKSSLNLPKEKCDVFIDPLFHIRIVNPLVSSAVLQERMAGRDAVQFCQLTRYLQTKTSDRDWVLAGVVANKSAVKTSQKGQKFMIWTLTDLKDDIKTVSVFLFGTAYSQLWKTQVGVVVGILNPSVLDKKDGSKDIVSTSLNIILIEIIVFIFIALTLEREIQFCWH